MNMVKVKVADAPDVAIEWTIARVENFKLPEMTHSLCAWFKAYGPRYCTDPALAWPIIDRKGIFLTPGSENMWPSARTRAADGRDTGWVNGETMLSAAMRCFVVSELGDEVEIPACLL